MSWNDEARRAAILGLALAGAGCRDAYAGPPGAKDYPAASGSASAAPPEPDPRPEGSARPWAPVFSDVALPETASEPPGKDEWASAPVAREARVTDPYCKVQRLREWYRVGCKSGQRVEVISGPREGVSFGCWKSTRDTDFCDDVWVIFPARRGDRRAIEFFRFVKWGPEADAVLTEQFLEGDPGPLISIQGIRWGF